MELLSQTRDRLRGRFGKEKQPATEEDGSGATPFRYSPLRHGSRSREFRLLKILPAGNFEDEIRCELFHSSLVKPPSYEALSYTWGDPEVTVPISLNDTPFQVTTNLGRALRFLRVEDEERIMWIDALCINQADIPEKNHQVRQMRDIYLGAEQVVAWLGEEREILTAVEFCQELPPVGVVLRPGEIVADQEQLDACEDLFIRRPYWKRMWVIQELYHGNNVLFKAGRVNITLELMYDMAFRYKYFSFIQNWTVDPHLAFFTATVEKIHIISALDPSRQEFKARTKANSDIHLLELLNKFRGQLAADPRDKVFALLGICSGKCGIEADYSMPRRDVYVAITRQLLKSSWYPLLMVESVSRAISSNQELPSWVPDFSDRQRAFPQIMWLYHENFNAGTYNPKYEKVIKTANPPLIETDSEVLTITAVYAATVTGVHRTKIPLDKSDDDLNDISLIRYDRDPTPHDSNPPYEPWPPNDSDVTYLNTSWAPHRTEVGDIIVVAMGCCVPLVLRRDGEGYLFVGMCWLITSRILTRVRGGSPGFDTDPGFEEIMRGGLWREVGTAGRLEKFHIH